MGMLNDLENLPDDAEELKGLVGLLAGEVKSQALMIKKLKHELAGHKRHRFGSSSESLDQLQMAFAEERGHRRSGERTAGFRRS